MKLSVECEPHWKPVQHLGLCKRQGRSTTPPDLFVPEETLTTGQEGNGSGPGYQWNKISFPVLITSLCGAQPLRGEPKAEKWQR